MVGVYEYKLPRECSEYWEEPKYSEYPPLHIVIKPSEKNEFYDKIWIDAKFNEKEKGYGYMNIKLLCGDKVIRSAKSDYTDKFSTFVSVLDYMVCNYRSIVDMEALKDKSILTKCKERKTGQTSITSFIPYALLVVLMAVTSKIGGVNA